LAHGSPLEKKNSFLAYGSPLEKKILLAHSPLWKIKIPFGPQPAVEK
jgi:hypothetical protein